MPFFFFDPTLIIAIPGLIFTLWAQAKVKSTYSKYSKVRARSGVTGAQVARSILDSSRLSGVAVEPIRGELTDHYDPKAGVLRLSEGVYNSQSIAALGIAAHESGHALQHASNYSALVLRTAVAPAAATGSQLGIILFMIGMFIPMFTHSSMTWLLDAGIILFSIAVLFTLITLPVEFNASRRALAVLEKGGYLTVEELPHAKKVLDAAAWTYVAAAATAVLTLIRLLIIRGASRD
ncbi:zinc metallopeptidase [bacterium]|nr:zinc metallopeptidase [bacterium]